MHTPTRQDQRAGQSLEAVQPPTCWQKPSTHETPSPRKAQPSSAAQTSGGQQVLSMQSHSPGQGVVAEQVAGTQR
jgi:hypothetical protein